MNIRKVYLGVIVVLCMALFYEWNAENQKKSEIEQLRIADMESATAQVSDSGDYVFLENDLLKLKISTKTGSLVESRLVLAKLAGGQRDVMPTQSGHAITLGSWLTGLFAVACSAGIKP